MKKNKNIKFLTAFILSILLIIGIPMIPIGFSKEVEIVGILGIVFTAVGFYGTPIAWINYTNFCKLYRLYNLIYHDKVYYMSLLASTTSQKIEIIEQEVNTLIQKGYLTSFIIVDDKLVNLKEVKNPNDYLANAAGKVQTITCEGCGYTYTYETTNGISQCPYCGKKSGK
ncbi:MAG: hypothetical protein SOZ32_00220 [Bacilli bacterium]|jgi:NAD-dependent SIR2 family protein deacetylase|nr:hypothetical protein [Mollicutes bacterium]MDY3898630.1 hypothetical protein [Bacilli bacterium]